MRTISVRAAAVAVVLFGISTDANPAAEVVLGQSLGLTGGGSVFARDYRSGALCHFESVNRSGGIKGRPIRLVSLDDGGVTQRTVLNTNTLLNEHRVSALFGYTSAGGTASALPILEAAGVPLLGIANGDAPVHDKVRGAVFHLRPSYSVEFAKSFELLRSSGMLQADQGVAFVYNREAKVNLGAFESAATEARVKVAASVGIDPNSVDQTATVTDVMRADPRVVLIVSTASATGALIKGLRKQGYGGVIVSSSSAGDGLIQAAGPQGAGTIVARIVPDPRGSEIGIQFRRAAAACAEKPRESAAALEGYIAARVMEAALHRAADIGPKAIITALETMANVDIAGLRVDFRPDRRTGLQYVELLIISKSGRFKR